MRDDPPKRHWRELCEAILKEPDPNKLLELVRMLNQELEEREKVLKPSAIKPNRSSDNTWET